LLAASARLLRLPPVRKGWQASARLERLVDRYAYRQPESVGRRARGHQAGLRLCFERRQLLGRQGHAELSQRLLLPRLVLLALGALVGRLPGRRLGPLDGPCVIRRQGTVGIVENTPKDLRVVLGGLGCLVAKRQQILGL